MIFALRGQARFTQMLLFTEKKTNKWWYDNVEELLEPPFSFARVQQVNYVFIDA